MADTQQRDVVKEISPPWMCRGVNEKFMYSLGLASDALLEKLNQAMKAHMPGIGTPTANAYIGLDRVMAQGPVESNSAYVTRLTKSFDTWQLAGNRQAIMSQVSLYMQGYAVTNVNQVPRVVVVNRANKTAGVIEYTVWDTYYNTSNINLPPSHVRVDFPNTNWNWDGLTHWWRTWMILFFEPTSDMKAAQFVFGTAGIKIGQTPNASIGLNVPPTVFPPLRSLMRLWKSGNTFYEWIILCFTAGSGGIGDKFSPNSVIGAGNPDATWGRWGTKVAGIYQQSRDSTCRYIDGTGIYVDCSVPIGM